MRSGQLPPHLALCGSPCRHWIVSATNESESYKLFCRHRQQALESKGSSLTSLFSRASRRFCVDHFLPEDWSALLRRCRWLTSPDGSFNFSFPGDVEPTVAGTASSSAPSAGQSEAVVNAAFMHIVERRCGDFVPNNMIYHELQQRYVVGPSFATGASEASTDFCSWLRRLQEQSDEDKEEGAASVDIFREKASSDRKKDPLARNASAIEKTMQNQKVCLCDFSRAAGDGRQGVAVEPIFVFFPHPVNVSDCIPYRSRHFVVMVNHKPIVPGHLMVVPIRCVGTIGGLLEEEVEEWGHVMCLTLRVLCRLRFAADRRSESVSDATPPADYNADGGFSIAIQQGALAGQTVPHLHTHVIPFNPRGNLAGKPEDEELQKSQPIRTGAQMREETEMLKSHFDFLLAHE